MSLFQIFNVSGSATSAQTQRLNVVASNLANADTVAAPGEQAYKARQVVFQTQLMGEVVGTGGQSGAALHKLSARQYVCFAFHQLDLLSKDPFERAARARQSRVLVAAAGA